MTQPQDSSTRTDEHEHNQTQPCASSRKNLLMLSILTPGCGNLTTANRIKCYFDDTEYNCSTCDAESFEDAEEFHDFLKTSDVHGVIGIHAYRAGRLLCGSPVPYILMFGGTDINVMSEKEDKMSVMTQAVKEASALVCFCEAGKEKVLSLWGDTDPSCLTIIPQGVDTSPALRSNFDVKSEFQLTAENPVFFTLVAGIRPVKDPLFLVKACSEWHQSQAAKTYLIILGAIVDEEYGKKFTHEIAGCPGVFHVNHLAKPDAHYLIQHSFAVVNSSINEGMCGAVLEAQKLRVPVIVRDNPGNRALVTDGVTGMLYSTPQEFLQKAQQLTEDDTTRLQLISNAQQVVDKNNSCQKENMAYLTLVRTVLPADAQQSVKP